ncbi:MarR family winged helix-turn-helix transcriptional regulator [Spirosoma flavum]|uniref:MarR family winged helix-turn-helix transcriptional regulator n=1 Tax=Spirosoma flavum TaxID=2048557 RepID=A0ABW6AIY5_9BACT
MEELDQIVFYSLEKAIKLYRQFAQRRLNQHGFDITIDQWLILTAVRDQPDWTQQQIAKTVFKDVASVTRMIDLLVKKQYLTRIGNSDDRRRFTLTLTDTARQLLDAMQPVIVNNRQCALQNLDEQQLTHLQNMLHLLIKNCQS